MASGVLTVHSRPLRIAFLVNPNDRVGLRKVIEANTFIWGGVFNPIIPVYKRTPKNWETIQGRKSDSPAEIVKGYLDSFDPDIVVPVGKCANEEFDIGHRQLVTLKDLLGNYLKNYAPAYGIGFFEILNNFIDKELKFKRNDDLKFLIPKLSKQYNLFLGSVFGLLPARIEEIVRNEYSRGLEIHYPIINIKNYHGFFDGFKSFPRRLTSWTVDHGRYQEAVIFLCDGTSSLDVIDYWNLRAAGYTVYPIPIHIFNIDGTKETAEEFIIEHRRPYSNDIERYHHVTIQLSRSVSESDVEDFINNLEIPTGAQENEPKFMVRTWYPRLWDSWARENSREGVIKYWANEREDTIPENASTLDIYTLDPKIGLSRNFSSHPRFANDLSFRFYGSKEVMAEVLPEGSQKLSSAVGRLGFRDWRFSSSGPVFLANRSKQTIYLELPRAENLMIQWLNESGWKATLSPSGRMATQLVKQLGGTWGLNWIAHKGVIELMSDLEREGGIARQAVIGKLKQVISADDLGFDSERFLELLIESNALKLGGRVQCPVCTRHNWYELDGLKYEMRCRFCLSDFPAPIHSPKNIEWTYRAHGPFASSVSQGAFSVLLTLKFLSGSYSHDHRVTPLFSYTAKKQSLEIEADLTCLYQPSSWMVSKTQVVHAECKSFNGFEKIDFQRMKTLGNEFPGSVLVFATLKTTLAASEVSVIKTMALAQRKKRLRGQIYNPIIILTGTELFTSHGFPHCWKNKEGLYQNYTIERGNWSDLVEISDATQVVYLGINSWHDWRNTEWSKKSKKTSISQIPLLK